MNEAATDPTVGEVVRRIQTMLQEEARRLKEEKEMERAMLMDDMRNVVKEVLQEDNNALRSKLKRLMSWIVSQI